MRSSLYAARGFTLVEVLVALAIVGVALAAALRAAGVGAANMDAMGARSLALWSAQNRLAELRLQRTLPKVGVTRQPCVQGGLNLLCETQILASTNRSFRQARVRVRVRSGDGAMDGLILAELHGVLSGLP